MTAQARMNRLFGKDGNCFDVAIDHGIFNEFGFLRGIESIHRAIEAICEANPDAIQLSPGQASILQAMPGKHKPALVMRTDVANVYGKQLPEQLFSEVTEAAVEKAVQLDAACIVVNLICNPGQAELYRQCVRNVMKLKPACERYGMPLMVEPLIMKDSAQGGYEVDGKLERIIPLVRQAVELGADIIKADPCDDPEQFHLIVEAGSGKPVLPRGGGMASERAILERTRVLMGQGARGIVYGRNIIQHRDPKGITQAFMAIVHENATVEEALAHVAP